MSVFKTLQSAPITTDQAAMRVKRSLAQTFQQIEIALGQVRQVMERHGVKEINSALGDDRAEVANLYGSLKALIEQHKPGAEIPSLPK